MKGVLSMTEKVDNNETQLVVFIMENEEFACNINDVREVLKMVKVTPLPRSLDYIEGIINMRGEIIPVVNLRKRFGLPKGEQSDDCRIIIVEVEERMVGLIVDAVHEVTRLANNQIQPTPVQVSGEKTDLITGVGKSENRMLIILNLSRILTSEEQIALDDITQAGQEILS